MGGQGRWSEVDNYNIKLLYEFNLFQIDSELASVQFH